MSLIINNDAKCLDCYKCVRYCPVKAISVQNDQEGKIQVKVIEECCIHDGLCISVCPQKAKTVSSCLNEVKELLLKKTATVVASVAPSFPAALPLAVPELFPAALKELGFNYVEQTSVGAELIAEKQLHLNAQRPVISSACPIVINLVEQYYPHLIPYLSPLVSPMIAHCRYIKNRYPDCITVFIGPCIAKMGEALSEEVKGAVDFVLGFNEVWEWIREDNPDWQAMAAEGFDGYTPGPARFFPLEGGQLLASYMSTDLMARDVQAISGLDNCITLLKNFTSNLDQRPAFTELLACSGGCLGGPAGVSGEDIYVKRSKMMVFYRQENQKSSEQGTKPLLPDALLYRAYKDRQVHLPVPDEAQIKKILSSTGKQKPEDELNCGACGFDTCQEKAVAVHQGRAELQMCLPYMRKNAETLSDMVLQSLPAGVLIVGEDLSIQQLNPMAEKIFDCTSSVLGQPLELLFDPEPFRLALQEMTINESLCHLNENKAIKYIIIPLGQQKAMGVFTDITDGLRQQKELQQVKSQTILRAQEVIKKQMTVAQVIAGLLGETTAETKVHLNQLIKLMEADTLGQEERNDL